MENLSTSKWEMYQVITADNSVHLWSKIVKMVGCISKETMNKVENNSLIQVSAAISSRIHSLVLVSSVPKEKQQESCLRRVKRIAKVSHQLLYGDKLLNIGLDYKMLEKNLKVADVRAHSHNHWPNTVWHSCHNYPSPGLELRSPGEAVGSDHLFSILVGKEWKKGDSVLGSAQETSTMSDDSRQWQWQCLTMTDTVPEGRKGVSSTDGPPAKLKSRKQQLPGSQSASQQLQPTSAPIRAEITANVVFLCTGLLNKTGLGSTQTWCSKQPNWALHLVEDVAPSLKMSLCITARQQPISSMCS